MILFASTLCLQAFGESRLIERGVMVQYELKLMSSDWVCSDKVAGASPRRNPYPYNKYKKECVIGLSNITDRLSLDHFGTIKLKSVVVESELNPGWGFGNASQDNTKYKPIRIDMYEPFDTAPAVEKAIKEGKLYITLIYEGIRK